MELNGPLWSRSGLFGSAKNDVWYAPIPTTDLAVLRSGCCLLYLHVYAYAYAYACSTPRIGRDKSQEFGSWKTYDCSCWSPILPGMLSWAEPRIRIGITCGWEWKGATCRSCVSPIDPRLISGYRAPGARGFGSIMGSSRGAIEAITDGGHVSAPYVQAQPR